ncbi:MAG: type II toxin-antitoxin system prevent-host-death family antitoxin [Acidobacteriaceae bacterium]
MNTIGAGAFKAKCLALLNEVQETGEPILITKRGKPVAQLVPLAESKPESLFGALKGKLKIVGDILSPIVEPWEWDEDIFPPGTPEREEFERKKKKSAAKASSRVAFRAGK